VDRALAREFTLLLTVPLVLEYEAVLRREEDRKVHGLTVSQLDELMNSLVRVAEPVQIRFLWRPVRSDPRDDMVLETAVNGRADLLVTFNQKDFATASKGFAHETVRPPPKCSSLPRKCHKSAAKSQSTLELKTEEWVNG
jgi:predicted nucleic acid-binding protein